MAKMKFETRLLEKMPRVADIASFRFQRPPAYEFAAGQWSVITIAPRGGERQTHHFTHSSSPTEPFLELTTRLRGTPFKNALDALPLGAEVTMEGPQGYFTLRPQDEHSVFLTGGIGITPVRSMLRSLADEGKDRRLTLFYANRDQDNIAFREELEELDGSLSGLEIVHVLGEAGPEWQGPKGRIDAALLHDRLETLSGLRFYLSGPPPMVEAMRDLLRLESVPLEAVVLERFDGY